MKLNGRTKILVLCTGNSCRSQMAEGFFREFGGDKIEVFSAGLTTHGLNPRAVRSMAAIGIDISAHESESIEIYLDQSFGFIFTVCDNAAENCPIFPGNSESVHWSFEDPALATGTETEIMAEFDRVRDEIGGKIKEWLSSRF